MQNGLVQRPHVAAEHQQGFLSCKVPCRDALAPHWLLSQEFQCWKEECPRNLAVKISGNSNRRLLISKTESELAWWDLFTPPLWLPEIQPQPTQVLPEASFASEPYRQLAGSYRPWSALGLLLTCPRPSSYHSFSHVPPGPAQATTNRWSQITLHMLPGSPRPNIGRGWTWPTWYAPPRGPITNIPKGQLQTTTQYYPISPKMTHPEWFKQGPELTGVNPAPWDQPL